MIQKLNPGRRIKYAPLTDFIARCYDVDFYYTHQNKRVYIEQEYNLKNLFKESENIYFTEEKGDFTGLILIWKSVGGEKTRNYVKLLANDKKVADNLLTQLLWSFTGKDLFLKVKKNNKNLSVFYNKKFKFLGGRGSQILLCRKSFENLIKKNG